MTSFSAMQRLRRGLIDKLLEFSNGLDDSTVDKIITYAECLVTGDNQEISMTKFMSEMTHQFSLNSYYMITTIFDVFNISRRGTRKSLTLEQYCKLICTFLTTNLDVKIDFVFSVYDVDQDGFITRAEAYTHLKPTIPQEDDEQEDMLKELIELVLKAVDRDGNGRIDLEEFRELVKKDVLCIELLGQCLPEEKDVQKFKNKLLNKSSYEVKELFEAEQAKLGQEYFGFGKPQSYYPIKLEFSLLL
ncbi:hypothetical protein BsWGS_17076 [Bradybaena similaris]